MRPIGEILQDMSRGRLELRRIAPLVEEPDRLRIGVLICDDEPLWLKYAARSIPADVYPANSAEQAVQILEQHGDEIAVLVTDIRMPGHDGEWLIDQTHERWPHIECMAITAHASGIDRIRAKVSQLFTKPVRMDDLLQPVARALCARA